MRTEINHAHPVETDSIRTRYWKITEPEEVKFGLSFERIGEAAPAESAVVFDAKDLDDLVYCITEASEWLEWISDPFDTDDEPGDDRPF